MLWPWAWLCEGWNNMVEIIPKQQEGQPLSVRVFAAFSIGALAAALGGFFLLLFLETKSQEEEVSLQTLLATEKTQEQVALEQEIFAARDRLRDFAQIAEQRGNPLAPFLFVESTVHPQAVVRSAVFEAKSQSIQLLGNTSSFRALQEQVLVLKDKEQEQGIKASLGALKLAATGGVDFKISVRFPLNFYMPPAVQEQEEQEEQQEQGQEQP